MGAESLTSEQESTKNSKKDPVYELDLYWIGARRINMFNSCLNSVDKDLAREPMRNVALRYFEQDDHNSLLQESRLEYFYLLMQRLMKRESSVADVKVLEVGAGCGFNLLVLEQLGFRSLVGTDIKSQHMWSSFQKIHSLTFLQHDAENETLPFADETFDVLLLIDVLEHLYDPAFCIGEISRVLRKDGLLVIRTPNSVNLKRRILTLFGKSPYGDLEGFLFKHRMETDSRRSFLGHVREYTANELERILTKFCFKTICYKYCVADKAPTVRESRFLPLYNIVEKMYPRWRYNMIVLAEKKH